MEKKDKWKAESRENGEQETGVIIFYFRAWNGFSRSENQSRWDWQTAGYFKNYRMRERERE